MGECSWPSEAEVRIVCFVVNFYGKSSFIFVDFDVAFVSAANGLDNLFFFFFLGIILIYVSSGGCSHWALLCFYLPSNGNILFSFLFGG